MKRLISEHNASQDTGLCPETVLLASSLLLCSNPLFCFLLSVHYTGCCCYFIDRIHPHACTWLYFYSSPYLQLLGWVELQHLSQLTIGKGLERPSPVDNSNPLLLRAGASCHILHKHSELHHQKAFKVTFVARLVVALEACSPPLLPPREFWLFVYLPLCTALFSQRRKKRWLLKPLLL